MPAVASVAGLPSRLGKYELLMPLAAGGMARIYIGRSTGIGSFERHVVLKMITPERANDQIAVSMFLDEARLAASLNHQNVGQVFEVGEDQGIHYLAMEYVHGQDLRAVLAKAGSQGTRIPLELALTVVAGAAAGLNHAHERRGPDGTPLGIVHRDVSPSNLMIGYDGAVKLLDFGIAKATQRSVETQSGIIKGKFAYMAPEQCRGRDVDRRSDVFSLGIILYEVSTQHRCFRADSDFDTMHRIVTGDVVRPTRLVQGYPQALEAIVMKALAVDAVHRYQSAGLLLEALEAFAVSNRMSLSTMGLGRFMRDMFGEVQEPWLNTAATKVLQPFPPKEGTISSTDGRGRGAHDPLPYESSADGIPDEDASFPDSARSEAAKTTLDLPRNPSERMDEEADWTPKPNRSSQSTLVLGPVRSGEPELRPTYPPGAAVRPSYPPGVTPPGMTPPSLPMIPMTPGMPMPSGTQPMPMGGARASLPAVGVPVPSMSQTGPMPRQDLGPSPTAFSQQGSGSGPAIPAMGISTKHGYASAAMSHSDVSYPRYDAPADIFTPISDLKPNRRPLYIGLGIVVVGVIVILAVTLRGGTEKDHAVVPEDDTTGSSTEMPQSGAATSEVKAPTPTPDVVDENMVSVVIQSDPTGADVLIAGTKIGVTPLDTKLKRGTKVAQLTVHVDGYVDFSTKIDLGGEYENKNIKLAQKPTGEKATGENEKATGEKGTDEKAETDVTDEKSGEKTGTKAGTGTKKASPVKANTGTKTVKTGTKTTTKTNAGEKAASERAAAEKAAVEKAAVEKAAVEKAPPAPKCQKPGPNVDPFSSIPVCK